MKNNHRIEYFDVARGISMIFVMLGHSFLLSDKVTALFCSFYMSIFFFISGYLYKSCSFRSLLNKLCYGLVIPYFSGIFILFIISRIIGLDSNIPEIAMSSILYADSNLAPYSGQLWFLYVLFFVQIIFWFLSKIDIKLGGVIALIIIMEVFDVNISIFRLTTVIMAIPVFASGYLFKENNSNEVIKKIMNLRTWQLILMFLLSIFLSYFHYCVYNGSISYWSDIYNNLFLFYLNAFLGTIVWINISKCISLKTTKLKNILMIVGRDTVPLLIFHPLLLAISRRIFRMLFFEIPTGLWIDNMLSIILVTFVVLFIELFSAFIRKTKLKNIYNLLLCGNR